MHSSPSADDHPGMIDLLNMWPRIEGLLEKNGWSMAELSRRAGLNESFVKAIKRGDSRSPQIANVDRIARAFGLTLGEFLEVGAAGSLSSSISPGVVAFGETEYASLPRYEARLSAGPGALLEQEPEPLAYHLIELQWLRSATRAVPENLMIVQVDGDSMEPTLSDEDWVLVDTTQRRVSRQGVYAIRFGDAVWVKRLQPIISLQKIRIHSDNPAYDAEDVEESAIEPIGRVVSIVARRL